MPKTFKETRKFLNTIPCLNLGGCGAAALAMYDAAKREGKKPKIVYMYNGWDEAAMKKNNKFKEGKVKKAHAATHVVLKIGKTLWDSTGKLDKKRLCDQYTMDDTITRAHLIASVSNRKVWNDAFNRERWLPKIAKYFKRGTDLS